MRHEAVVKAVTSTYVRLHARRVALVATVLAFVVYLLVCAIADLLVVNRLNTSIDTRLVTEIYVLNHELPHPAGAAKTIDNPPNIASGDIGDAPILAWFVPSGAKTAQRLTAESPSLPRGDLLVSHLINGQVAGRNLRIDGAAVRGGRIVLATSTAEATSVRNTLFVIEAALAPVLFLALFLVATVIGRRAASPIERARLRQLEFTANASHELRTPLSVIQAEIGLALSANRSAAGYRAALERVAGESKHLRVIVDDLLWLARLDSQAADPPDESVDLIRIVRACTDRFGEFAPCDKRVISIVETGSFPAFVLARPDWIDRLVSALLDNACRYSEEGGRIELAIRTSEDRVMLAVDDNGPGIAEDERERLMQRFQRASTVPSGAGLGLSIANAVARATAGECLVTTAPLGGARIQVSWPRFQAHDGIDPRVARRVDIAKSTTRIAAR